MFTEELFNGIKAKGGSGTTYEVKFSMLEIYNEVVRDLLDPKGGQKKGGLKVRQHPKKGFYGKYQNSCVDLLFTSLHPTREGSFRMRLCL